MNDEMRKVLTLLGEHFGQSGVHRLDTPFAVDGLHFEDQVAPALRRLATGSPPFITGVEVDQLDYPAVITGITERGWSELEQARGSQESTASRADGPESPAQAVRSTTPAGSSSSTFTEPGRAVLTEEQRVFLDWVEDYFRTNATWPTFRAVDSALDRSGLDATHAIETLGPDFVSSRQPRDDELVVLTLDGLSLADHGGQTIGLFLKALSYCVERERRHTAEEDTQPCAVSRDELSEHWRSSAGENQAPLVAHAFRLLLLDQWIQGGSSGYPDGNWALTLNKRGTRRYRGVQTWEEYKARRGEDRTVPIAVHYVPATLGMEGLSTLRLSGADAPSRGALHPRVEAACRDRFASGFHADGVLQALKVLPALIRERTGCVDKREADLIGWALQRNGSVLRLGDLSTDFGRDRQLGAQQMALGVWRAFRHVLTHDTPVIQPQDAEEIVSAVSCLVRLVDGAELGTVLQEITTARVG